MFSTPEREEILSEALYAEEISVSELARNLCLSKGLASQYLRFLVKEGILRRKGRKFSVDRENPKVKALKVLLNVKQLSEIFVYLKDVKGSIGLYGSWANGTNTKESDVDIWVKGELSEEKIAELKGKISRKMGKIIAIAQHKGARRDGKHRQKNQRDGTRGEIQGKGQQQTEHATRCADHRAARVHQIA